MDERIKNEIELLNSLDEYLIKLKDGILKAVNYIQEGREQNAIQIIPNISEGLDWVIQAVSLTRDVQKDKIDISDISEHVKEVVEAFENEDYILVGDLFEYEIGPILERIEYEIKECI